MYTERTQKAQLKLHIRFLADNGRRSWASIANVVPFTSIEDFERMRSELPHNVSTQLMNIVLFADCNEYDNLALLQLKSNDPRARAFIVTPYHQLMWQQAQIEAQILMTFAIGQRMQVFERTLTNEMEMQTNTSSSSSNNKKRRLSIASQETSFNNLYASIAEPIRTSTPSILNHKSIDDSVALDTSAATTTRTSVPTRRSMSRSPTPESPEYEELSMQIASFSEEPADNKVHNYLRSMASTTIAHDDTNGSGQMPSLNTTDSAQLESFANDDSFVEFYRNVKDNIFVDYAHSNEQHLKHLALKMWLLKRFQDFAVSPITVAADATTKSRKTVKTEPVSRPESTTSQKRQHVVATAVRRSIRESRGIVHSHSSSSLDEQKQLQQQQHEEATRIAQADRLAKRTQRLLEKEQRDAIEMSRYYMREHPKNTLFRGLNKELVCRLCHRRSAEQSPLRKCHTATCNEHVHSGCAARMRAGIVDDFETVSDTVDGKRKVRKVGERAKTKIVLHVAGDHEETALVDVADDDYDSYSLDGDENVVADVTGDPVSDDYCPDCWPNRAPVCFVCKAKADGTEMRCTDKLCGRHYHIACLKYWPQHKLVHTSNGAPQLLCPCHVCHICISDDPRGKHYHIKSSALMKCVCCSATYHCDSNCIPAGSRILTASQLICPRHRVESRQPVNANWCFICTKGGELICCETCPTAFHADCLCVALPDRYICEECETGRLPLYGECVWAKLAQCRWWPAVTVPPSEIPDSVLAVKRKPHDFAIRFFGTNDYGWMSRGFVFLYQDGDSECNDATPWLTSGDPADAAAAAHLMGGSKKGSKHGSGQRMELMYQKALVQAKAWYERFCVLNAAQDDRRALLKPLPYIKCRTNWPVPPVRLVDPNENKSPVCECRDTDDDPCGASCWNVMLQIECHPSTCGAGARCQNQRFERRQYPNLTESRMEGKGWGLVTIEPIVSGAFIIEYVGELINRNEFERRFLVKQELKEEHYYFLTLSRELLIDAGPRGNSARFINHSCEPNCETQVWQVRGNQRVGLFAIEDIPAVSGC